MITVYLGLGSNLGDRQGYLDAAVEEIKKKIGFVKALSSFIETQPAGFESEHLFLNAAIGVETELPLISVLDETQAIERHLGRRHKSEGGHYSDRVIDIDVLFYGSAVYYGKRIVVPHPHVEERIFVLEPLMEIAPDFVHPESKKTIREIYQELKKNKQDK